MEIRILKNLCGIDNIGTFAPLKNNETSVLK